MCFGSKSSSPKTTYSKPAPYNLDQSQTAVDTKVEDDPNFTETSPTALQSESATTNPTAPSPIGGAGANFRI